MAFAFDTLGYAKKLRESGVPQDQAEAHAEAAREFIMAELVTRYDLDAAITSVRQEIGSVRQEIETQTLRLTVRLGVMLAAGLSILAALVRLH
ncbi:MAG: hypothetical protein JO267_02350 [Alphaproteobacteria bacterium]|nr:hypothetical protein [Alphaproteobacteria bacterium]